MQQVRAARVGLVLARPRERHLQQTGGDRSEDHHQQRAERVAAIAVAASEQGAPERDPRDERDAEGDRGSDRSDEDVAVLHVRELVGENATELVAVEDLQDAPV